jgi:hypothetical protein
MAFNNFSVGRDVSVDFLGPTGPVRFNLITGFESMPDTNEVKIKGLDGIVRFLSLPDGWRGTLEVERGDSVMDDYFAQLESQYYSGLNIQALTITQTVQEPGGNVSQYRYEGVVLKLDSAGSWKGDDSVKQKISFMASRRKKIL